MRYRLAILCFFVAIPPIAGADCAPKNVLRIVTQAEGPRIHEGTFAAQPRTVYRFGSKYARVEEAPDRKNNIHGLIVVNQPDSWMVNLADRTGRHFVDREKDGKVHVPVFAVDAFGSSFPSELAKIEMGCEVEFFDSFRSPTTSLRTNAGTKVKQAVGVGEWRLVLIRDDPSAKPGALFVFRGDDIVFVLRYLTFEQLPSADLTLFEQPKEITFTEEPQS